MRSISSVYGPQPAVIAIVLLLLLALLISAVLFLLTQHRTLLAVKKVNRQMAPGLIWLQLIPVFGQLWQFIVVSRIAGSARREFESQGEGSILGVGLNAVDQLGKRPTLGMGITYCSLNSIYLILYILTDLLRIMHIYYAPWMSTVVGVLALSSVTCWIIYWVQLAEIKRKILSSAS